MTVLITLTIAGTDSGPFDLYSNLDGYLSAFESGVSKASLLAGYPSSLVPDFTTTIRVRSNNGLCTNYVDIPVEEPTTTTTTTAACIDSYSYDINIYSCGTCTLLETDNFDNLYPLTIGKFYYSSELDAVIEIVSYTGCGGFKIGPPILDIDQQEDCFEVSCTTTTTTTSSSSTSTTTTTTTITLPLGSSIGFPGPDTCTSLTITSSFTDGGGTLTQRGICYNTTGNPTIADSIFIGPTVTGVSTINVTGLTPNTNYYWRAYAINELGVGYYQTVLASPTGLNFPTDVCPTTTTSTTGPIT
jgi:hypothetical protein